MSDLQNQKKLHREKYLELRRSLEPDPAAALSGKIQQRLLTLTQWRKAKFICIYLSSLPGEVDTLSLVRTGLAGGKKFCVPFFRAGSQQMCISKINDLDNLRRGPLGILQPVQPQLIPPERYQWDLVIVPGLVFDRQGNRLGLGTGYYDHLLTGRREIKIALAFDFQVLKPVETLPHDKKDVPVDIIVTENEIIWPKI